MNIKTIPLSHLETNLEQTLRDCADAGETLVVELSDHQLFAIQPLEMADDDSLIDNLIEKNAEFRALIAKSKASGRKPFRSGDA